MNPLSKSKTPSGKQVGGDELARLLRVGPDSLQVSSQACRFGLVAANVNHPALLHGMASREETAQIAEMWEGTTLESHLAARAALPADEAFAILRQLASALDALNDAGVQYLCLRTSAILLSEPTQVRLFDHLFDYAQLPPEALLPVVACLPPEYLAGTQLTSAVHVFALARIAYRLLFSQEAFERPSLAEQLFALSHALWNEEPVGIAIKPVFDRAFSRDPAARFKTCEAFFSELQTAWRAAASAPTRLADALSLPQSSGGLATARARKSWAMPLLTSRYALRGGWIAAALAAAIGLGCAEASRNLQTQAVQDSAELARLQKAQWSGASATNIGRVNGRLSVCNASASPAEISMFSALYWDDAGKLHPFNNTASSVVWHARAAGATPISLSAPDGTILWDGSTAFYAMVVNYQGQRFLAGGLWNQPPGSCVLLVRNGNQPDGQG